MRTVQEMDDFAELEDYVTTNHGSGEVEVKPYGYDPRIRWDTHVVTLDGRAVGFTNEMVSA